MTGISLYQSATLFKGNRITIGADYFNFGGKSWNFFPEEATKTMLVDKTQHEIAGYADFRQHLGSWLTLDAGIRLDHHSHAGTQWIPQAGISFNLPSNIDIKVMASKGFRFPTIREMYMFRPANPDLRPESMWNYEISFAQRLLEGKLSYGINIFYIDGKNTIQTLYVEGRMMNVNTGKIDNAGVEIQMLYRISPAWSADVSYSFLHMKYPVVAAPEHKLCAGASFTKRRWMVSTDIQYIDGLYTAVGTSDGKDNRTENFVLWSLRGRFAATKWLALWVRGENLLAQKYEINAGFPMPKATVMGGMEINF